MRGRPSGLAARERSGGDGGAHPSPVGGAGAERTGGFLRDFDNIFAPGGNKSIYFSPHRDCHRGRCAGLRFSHESALAGKSRAALRHSCGPAEKSGWTQGLDADSGPLGEYRCDVLNVVRYQRPSPRLRTSANGTAHVR